MFIELWRPLEIKLHENNSDATVAIMKDMINNTLLDLSNMYDFEFLTKELNYTTTADDQEIRPGYETAFDLSAATIIYAYTTATGDSGTLLTINGKRINDDNTYDVTSETLVLSSNPDTVTASGSISFSHIDSFIKTGTTGTVVILDDDNVEIANMTSSVDELAPNIGKITGIYTGSKVVIQMDFNTIRKGSPAGSFVSDQPYYDLYGKGIKLFNLASATEIAIMYQAMPKVLNQNIDRTEFPRFLWPKIIEAAFLGFGLRYEDESDGTYGLEKYNAKLGEVVSDYLMGRGASTLGKTRVMPAHIKRRA